MPLIKLTLPLLFTIGAFFCAISPRAETLSLTETLALASPSSAIETRKPIDIPDTVQPTLLTNSSTKNENGLELNTSLAAPTAPLTLTTARNVELTLIPQNGDLWERLRSGFTLQESDNPLIAKHEQWYAQRPEYVARMMERAGRYLFYITSEVERRGMPAEIALLPMIESAFNPVANSTSNAAGIWQFMPSTGRNFGLQQNWWYDGRRDIISATNGALDYLEKLHNMFGDWKLALAAYNWGEGAVQRAQERNRKKGLPTDYESLKMPDETSNYVPKLLAIKNIVANPEHFGLELPGIPNKPYFAKVQTEKHIDVKLVAQLADISKEEFVALNPAHNRPVILQDSGDYILLPTDKVDKYRVNLENYDKPLVSWQAYHANKGERLDRLAPRFGLSVDKLKSINSLTAHGRLNREQMLLVPINNDAINSETEFEAFNMHLHPVAKENSPKQKYAPTIQHIVHRGETLPQIARQYQVSIKNLKRWNGQLKQIKPGQTLTIVQLEKPTSSHKKSRAASRSSTRKVAQHKTIKQASRKRGKKINLAFQGK